LVNLKQFQRPRYVRQTGTGIIHICTDALAQRHDRAVGERLGTLTTPEALRAVTVMRQLSPVRPLLFMGQGWASRQPLPFFCDFEAELADKIKQGRRCEFAYFADFQQLKPAPQMPAQMKHSVAPFWTGPCAAGSAHTLLELYRKVLDVRRRLIVRRLAGTRGGCAGRVAMEDVEQPEGNPLCFSEDVQLSKLASTSCRPGRSPFSWSRNVR
jgi:hypothetical protein